MYIIAGRQHGGELCTGELPLRPIYADRTGRRGSWSGLLPLFAAQTYAPARSPGQPDV